MSNPIKDALRKKQEALKNHSRKELSKLSLIKSQVSHVLSSKSSKEVNRAPIWIRSLKAKPINNLKTEPINNLKTEPINNLKTEPISAEQRVKDRIVIQEPKNEELKETKNIDKSNVKELQNKLKIEERKNIVKNKEVKYNIKPTKQILSAKERYLQKRNKQ